MSRENTIIRTSIIGIIANVLLAAFKAVIGILTGSIAIAVSRFLTFELARNNREEMQEIFTASLFLQLLFQLPLLQLLLSRPCRKLYPRHDPAGKRKCISHLRT